MRVGLLCWDERTLVKARDAIDVGDLALSGAGLAEMRTEIEEKHGCVFPALRVSAGEIKACFEAYDRDGSGFIDYHEFLAAVQKAAPQQPQPTGVDSKAPNVLQKLHNSSWISDLDDANAVFDRFDTDLDGKISKEEFATGWCAQLVVSPCMRCDFCANMAANALVLVVQVVEQCVVPVQGQRLIASQSGT